MLLPELWLAQIFQIGSVCAIRRCILLADEASLLSLWNALPWATPRRFDVRIEGRVTSGGAAHAHANPSSWYVGPPILWRIIEICKPSP